MFIHDIKPSIPFQNIIKDIKTFGKSMYPILYDLDIVYIKKVKFATIKINDIITVKKGNIFITHRVIYKNNRYLITKGDSNWKSDGKIYPHQIMGRVYQIKRKNKTLDPEAYYLFQSSIYFSEIITLTKKFKQAKIDFVFLKGLPVHLWFLKTIPRRLYQDCDILINKKDGKIIDKIFIENGYSKEKSQDTIVGKLFNFSPTQFSYRKKVNSLLITYDVHLQTVFMFTEYGKLRIFDPEKLIDDLANKFLKEKKEEYINGQVLPILSLENMIVYSLLNYFHHNFRGIFRLDFIYQLLKKYRNIIKWKVISQIIKKYRIGNYCFPTFMLLEKFFYIKLPKKFNNSIKPDKNKISYIKKNILFINIFDQGKLTSFNGHITVDNFFRVRNLFELSSYSTIQKMLNLFDPLFLYAVLRKIIPYISIRIRNFLIKLAAKLRL